MQLMGTKHSPVRMFSDGMDDFVMDEKTLKMTPGVAGLHNVRFPLADTFFAGLS